VVFGRLPFSQFNASYSIGAAETSLVGGNITIGFDSGAAFADLDMSPTFPGTFSYFIVHYPHDCSERILSTHPTDVLTRDVSRGRTCFFSGPGRRVTYRVFVSTESIGFLQSKPLTLPLEGDSAESIASGEPSVITWDNVKSVGIQVQVDGTRFGFSQRLDDTKPSFIVNPNEFRTGRKFS
jgi:hypothetical protein